MPKVVRVSFQPGGKAHLYDPEGLTLVPGDEVIVPVARGVGYGRVVSPIREVYSEEMGETLKKIMRRATPSDRERQRKNVYRKEEAYRAARGLIKKHGLLMKVVNVEYVFDGSSIVFYFTAEGRVDFRELVKDLASQLKARIELRQVGVRDEAKMVGGLGPCGRDLCCSLFLLDFDPVSIKMAKEQDLPLNPSKISGICGRLMCCLKYEVEAYRDFNSRAPSIGSHVETEQGKGRVLGYQVPRGMVAVELEAGRRIEVPIKELASRKEQRVKKGRRRKPSGRDGGEND
ncbi:MAG: stage 0 sporulation family protein [Actinobacteria bacterium]|nr:stage 0 sporulation family protein [Actinomycetota bacterium]MCG2817851.1 stage 0 sporulation family protein [Actinomycetes bacterium]MBU4217737.1 stage 0 sporulation family protein [Actinomycetota bacterium]MBU4358950.1 stage 0 sporulation family protein [Actinomycetota bacterium]MBU4391709.1 stage 0 sporulation family protein [Actinomycetota bacterium]